MDLMTSSTCRNYGRMERRAPPVRDGFFEAHSRRKPSGIVESPDLLGQMAFRSLYDIVETAFVDG